MIPLDVIIFDDEPDQLADFAKLFELLLSSDGDKVKVEQILVDASQHPDRLFQEYQKKLTERRPHIAILDNTFLKNDLTGMSIIARLKPKLPDTLFCLLTRQTISDADFGLHFPNPDLILSKLYIKAGLSDKYRSSVSSAIRAKIRRARGVVIEWPENKKFLLARIKDEKGKEFRSSEFDSVLEQILFDGHSFSSTPVFSIVEIPGGRSGALVLGCRRIGGLNYPIVMVIKISKLKDSMAELENYNKFVKWTLPYTWRIDVVGTGFSENIGGICYSFAFEGSGSQAPVSVSKLLSDCNSDIISRVCSTIFNPAKKTWYAEMSFLKEDVSAYFSKDPYFKKSEQIPEREKSFERALQLSFNGSFASEAGKWRLFDIIVAKPNGLIFTEKWGGVSQCVSHGDLNANNILAQESSGALAFIDFQNTGLHHVYKDFVSFEGSVRIDWGGDLSSANLQDVLAQEISLAKGEYDLIKIQYLKECAKVRRAAFLNFPNNGSDMSMTKLFLIATSIHLSWLVVRFTDFNDVARKRLMLGAVASLFVLEKCREESKCP